jgi:ABC-type multidrug transport system fused ATPase/permease subunit
MDKTIKQMASTLKKIVSLITPGERKKLGGLLLLDIVVNILDIGFLALLLVMVQKPHSSLLVVSFFLLFSLKNLAGFLVYRSQCRNLFRIASRMSRSRLLGYLEGSWTNYVNKDSSVQIREISYQPMEFCQHVLGGVQQIITQSVLIALTIIAIIAYKGKLFLLLLIVLLPPATAVFYIIKKRLRSAGQHAQASSERSLQHLQEALTGYVESNIYDKNEVFLNRYMVHQQRFNKHISDYTVIQGIPNRMIEIFALLGVAVLIVINQRSGSGDNTAVTTIGVFMAAAYKIIPGIVKILSTSGQISAYAFTMENMNGPVGEENLDEGEKLPDGKRAENLAGRVEEVSMEGVRFSYGDRVILDNQQLHISKGDFIGIRGASGKGKTTILNLLLGFLSPEKGEIRINDKPTGTYQRREYWPHISYVKQQPFLIHDTVLQNITLNGQSYNEQRLREAIAVSGLEEVIDAWPEKWNKVIAENGKDISGGQKQRIAIARALYKNADLIILDEPFNELDEESENSLLCHFKQLSKKGKLIILITHNKKSFEFCNKIVSLDEKQWHNADNPYAGLP